MLDLDAALQRLDRALMRLEGVVDAALDRAVADTQAQSELDVLINDRARLAEELDASMAREKELEQIADEASEALGSAIAEVRAALGRDS